MYKSTELSRQARLLAIELQRLGLTLGHAKMMELLARSLGARNLHVLQAKTKTPRQDKAMLAKAQASRLLFTSLGRYQSDVDGLLSAINAVLFLESKGSRVVEEAFSRIFEQPDSPELSAMAQKYPLSELPAVFEATQKALLEELEGRSGFQEETTEDLPLFAGPMLDWRVCEGTDIQELPAHHQTLFNVEVQRNGYQLYVDITPFGQAIDDLEGQPQLGLFIEINEGRPCVRITNAVYGDQVVSVTSTPDGLLFEPGTSDMRFTQALSSSGALLSCVQELYENLSPSLTGNLLVLETMDS